MTLSLIFFALFFLNPLSKPKDFEELKDLGSIKVFARNFELPLLF